MLVRQSRTPREDMKWTLVFSLNPLYGIFHLQVIRQLDALQGIFDHLEFFLYTTLILALIGFSVSDVIAHCGSWKFLTISDRNCHWGSSFTQRFAVRPTWFWSLATCCSRVFFFYLICSIDSTKSSSFLTIFEFLHLSGRNAEICLPLLISPSKRRRLATCGIETFGGMVYILLCLLLHSKSHNVFSRCSSRQYAVMEAFLPKTGEKIVERS